jgi:hypothetical protein
MAETREKGEFNTNCGKESIVCTHIKRKKGKNRNLWKRQF